MSSFTTSRFSALPLGEARRGDSTVVSNIADSTVDVPDELLLERVQSGDRDALSLLFRRYAQLVRGVGQRILRDRAEADDLVQELFLYIYRKSGLFNSAKGTARSWIMQVSYTQAFLRRRELKFRGRYLSGITDKPIECNQSGGWGGADYERTVEGLFGRIGWKKVVNDLTEDQLETLRLHFFEGFTFAEIAEKLGQSYANVRNHHYRGLEKFRKHLADNDMNKR
jgi:RNA polymerase sigma-70 factor, ECF subfamily